jgi:tetratricopeptide (TPR) repeat protein
MAIWEKIIKSLGKSKGTSGDAEACLQRGKTQYELGQYEQAIENFQQAIDLTSSSQDPHLQNIEIIAHEMRRKAKAQLYHKNKNKED